MEAQTLIYLVVGTTFALYIGIAVWSRAGSTGDFYIAGGGVHPVANGMATAADWMSAASFISMAGLIAFLGYDGSVYLMGWTGGYVLLALCLAPYLRKFGKFTVPDFIGDRYYSQMARTVAVICAIFVSFTYVAGQMRGVGVVFSRFLEVDVTTGVLIGMGVVFFYAVLGGMKGITYTQVAQYCVMIFAYTVPAIYISLLITGNPIPQLGFGSTLADGSGTHLLDKLDGLTRELGFTPFTEGKKSTIDMFCITAALMVGTAGLPHVIVRFFTVPKVRDARKSAFWALLFIAVLYTTAPAVGAFARTNMIETINGPEGQGVPREEMPSWVDTWETTRLIQWQDQNGDGRLFYSNDSRNEMTIDPDILVLANPEIAELPSDRPGGRRRPGRGAVYRRRAVTGDFHLDLPRPAKTQPHAPDFGKTGTDGRAPGSSRCHRCGGLSGHPSAGLCRRGGRFRVWLGGGELLPGNHHGHILQAHEPVGRRRGYAHRPGVYRQLYSGVQGGFLRTAAAQYRRVLATGDITGRHRFCRYVAEPGGRTDRPPIHPGCPAAHSGPGGKHPFPAGFQRS